MQLKGIVTFFPGWYRNMILNHVKCITPMRPACIGVVFLLEHLPVKKRKVPLVLKWIRNAWPFFCVQMSLVITAANCLTTEDNVLNCFNKTELPGMQELTDPDIIECPKSRQRRRGPGRRHRDQGTTCELALNGLELFVKFTEKSHYYNVAEIMDTHIMLNNAYKKCHSAIKQADIRDMFAKASKKVNPTQMDITEEITIEDDNPRPSTQREPEPQAGSFPLNMKQSIWQMTLYLPCLIHTRTKTLWLLILRQ